MTVRELLTKEKDYSVVKIVKDSEILWNEFCGWYDIDKKLLNMKVLKYDYKTVTVIDSMLCRP